MTANIIPEAKEIMLSTIPMKRMGQPEEIGEWYLDSCY